jgi:hypothetical protein
VGSAVSSLTLQSLNVNRLDVCVKEYLVGVVAGEDVSVDKLTPQAVAKQEALWPRCVVCVRKSALYGLRLAIWWWGWGGVGKDSRGVWAGCELWPGGVWWGHWWCLWWQQTLFV